MRGLWATPWVGLSVILALELLLQWFPLTGIFLMFLLAPFWSAILVNLILLAMALDAVMTRARRWLLIVPVGAYATYAFFAMASHFSCDALQREVAADNAAAIRPIDAAANVIDVPSREIADALAAAYQLPVVYSDNPNQPPAMHQASRLVSKAACDGIDVSGLALRVGKRFPAIGGLRVRNACLLTTWEDPAQPVVTVASQKIDRSNLFVQASLTTLTASNGAKATTGHAKVLSWIPMPIIGCFLNDGAARWDCFAQWSRETRPLGGADGWRSTAALGTALGLTPWRTLNGEPSRGLFQPGSVEVDADQLARNAIADAAHQLDRTLAETLALLPDALTGSGGALPPDSWALAAHADRLGARAEDLARWLVLPEPASGASQARLLVARTLAALPPEAYARVAPRLVRPTEAEEADALDTPKTRGFHESALSGSFLTRLGDAGPLAAPVLVQVLEHEGAARRSSLDGRAIPAVLGLCRIGPEAGAAAADAIVARVEAADGYQRRALTSAAYAALGRLGRSDLADKLDSELPQGLSHPRLTALTPASPASDCRAMTDRAPLGNAPWLDPEVGPRLQPAKRDRRP